MLKFSKKVLLYVYIQYIQIHMYLVGWVASPLSLILTLQTFSALENVLKKLTKSSKYLVYKCIIAVRNFFKRKTDTLGKEIK